MSRASQKYLKKADNIISINWDENSLPECCKTEQKTVAKEEAPKVGTIQLPKDTAVYQAIKVVRGERQADYGSPEKDFQRTTDMLSAYGFRFEDEHGNIRKLDATDFPIIMICAKLGRQANKHKDDNVIDIIGYADTLDMVVKARKADDKELVITEEQE